MKYLRYVSIILFKLFAKVFGLAWFFVALPFRGYARNAVYNYVLQNKLHLPRLMEREPEWDEDKRVWLLKDIHGIHAHNDIAIVGSITYRKISKLEYLFVFWFLWGWLDDDANHDTMNGFKREGMVYGNTFDLGDARSLYPQFELKESWAWLARNTAYNFNYMLEECAEDSKWFFYHRVGDWHFGYIPYTNSTRKGRMVWFSEDIDKVDQMSGNICYKEDAIAKIQKDTLINRWVYIGCFIIGLILEYYYG